MVASAPGDGLICSNIFLSGSQNDHWAAKQVQKQIQDLVRLKRKDNRKSMSNKVITVKSMKEGGLNG